jgi:hypothetical protein
MFGELHQYRFASWQRVLKSSIFVREPFPFCFFPDDSTPKERCYSSRAAKMGQFTHGSVLILASLMDF